MTALPWRTSDAHDAALADVGDRRRVPPRRVALLAAYGFVPQPVQAAFYGLIAFAAPVAVLFGHPATSNAAALPGT